MKRKICLILCVTFLMLALSSCQLTTRKIGVISADINENGELIVLYDDGSEENLGVVVGNNGADGKDGVNGTDGEAGEKGERGENGENGANGANGSLDITFEGSSIPAASAKGLRSAVSIVCKFQATVQQGWPYGGTTVKDYSSAGSGVIYKLDKAEGDAFIITNYHVVYDSSSNTDNHISDDINVYLYGAEIEGKEIDATYVGGSLYYDIAVLHIDNSAEIKASDVCATVVANSNDVAVGDGVIAIGNAKGYGTSASFGVVGVDSEYITMTAADDKTAVAFRVMRVDAAVNSGNSGGGLYDDEGNLIGIVNAKIIDSGVENIGYAIPSNIAVSVAENIIDYCYGKNTERVQSAMIGVAVNASDSKAIYDPTTGAIAIEETVVVSKITSGSLAAGAFQVDDVIVSVTLDGKTSRITRQYQIMDMMIDFRVGDVVTFNILRGGEEKTVSITITQNCLVEY